MYRVIAMIGALVVAIVPIGNAFASPPPGQCDPYSGSCTVVVHRPGDAKSPTATAPQRGSGACVGTDGKRYPCSDPDLGYWSGRCYWKVANPQPPTGSPPWEGHKPGDGAIYLYTCPPFGPGSDGGSGYRWEKVAPGAPTVTPAQLAQRAVRTVRLPHPAVGMSPDGRLDDGTRYTVVQVPTWFWTTASAYRTVTARAAVGGVWARVTVSPTGLSFTPGDGSAAVRCAGPGRAWVAGRDGQWDRAPGGCDFVYRRSSIDDPHRTVTATYAISWSVSWTGSGNTAGTLPAMTTSTTASFAVAEGQTVVTR